jgi:hypothetical protein
MDKMRIKNSDKSVNYMDLIAIVNTIYIFLNKLTIVYLHKRNESHDHSCSLRCRRRLCRCHHHGICQRRVVNYLD